MRVRVSPPAPFPESQNHLRQRVIIRLYRRLGFRLKFLNAPRRISSDGNRAAAREVLASKNI